MTLHDITLPYITNITINLITAQYKHYINLHYIVLHLLNCLIYIALHYNTLHYITLQRRKSAPEPCSPQAFDGSAQGGDRTRHDHLPRSKSLTKLLKHKVIGSCRAPYPLYFAVKYEIIRIPKITKVTNNIRKHSKYINWPENTKS